MLKEPSGTGCDELKLKCSQVRQSGCANFVVGVGGALELILDTAEGWMLPRRFVSRARQVKHSLIELQRIINLIQ